MIRARHLAPLAAVSTVAGLGAASLASGAREQPRRVRAVAAPVVLTCGPPSYAITRTPRAPRTSRTAPLAAAPKPSAKLLAAFGILRRPHAAGDALPPEALARLRAAGARFDPAAARLLRTTPRGGRAWIVPVADVGPLDCGLTAALSQRAALLPYANAPVPPVLIPAQPAVRVPVPVPRSRRAVPKRLRPAAPRLYRVPSRPLPVTPVPAAPARLGTPREGVVVVALGDAPSGGGGSLAQLLRARAVPAVEPCSGPGGELVAISGLAPDGVSQAFLTSPDGTAIKTAVKDNAYAFIVPPSRSMQPRYVVWMRQGLPQVSPVAAMGIGVRSGRVRCSKARAKAIRLSPSGPLLSALRPQYPVAALAVPSAGRRTEPAPRRLVVPPAVPASPSAAPSAVPAVPAVPSRTTPPRPVPSSPAAPAPSTSGAPPAQAVPTVTTPATTSPKTP